MSLPEVVSWIAGHKLLGFACLILLIELAFRGLAPKSAAYRKWTEAFKAVGAVWTALILSFVYLLSVGPISLGMRLRGKDLLDRSLAPEPTFWRTHEPNPLGPEAAARHQF